MTDNEKAVMTDCYKFLSEFSNPPAKNDLGCDEFWKKASEALNDLNVKNRNHPLAQKVGIGIFEYLEMKWAAINKKKGL